MLFKVWGSQQQVKIWSANKELFSSPSNSLNVLVFNCNFSFWKNQCNKKRKVNNSQSKKKPLEKYCFDPKYFPKENYIFEIKSSSRMNKSAKISELIIIAFRVGNPLRLICRRL